MNKYLENLNRLEFVVTMACTGKCKHCSQGEHNSSEHIDADAAVKAIYDVCSHYSIDSLMTFGGEPLLYAETVCKIHKAAKEMNIKRRELITNGYFSKSESRIKEVADRLSESGVSSILLSADAFHQETIPLEPVKYFAKCIMSNGIQIQAHPAWLVSEEDNNPYNIKTREILNEFSQMGIEISSGNIIFPSGNAKKYFADYFSDDKEYVSPYEENPLSLKAISFSPNGNVLGGNIYNDSIMDILNAYSYPNELPFEF